MSLQIKKVLYDLFLAGIKSVDPYEVVLKNVKISKNGIKIGRYLIKKPIYVFGAGKASYRMALGLEKVLGDFIKGGIVISTEKGKLKRIEHYTGTHPIPSKENFKYTEMIIEYMKSLKRDDIYIFLLSGGASALLEKPLHPITLDDLQKTTDILLKSGMDIHEINAFRKHISNVKGGRLAECTRAKGYVLVLSDVIGNDLGSIGSGPLYYDSTTYNYVFNLAQKYSIWESLPKSVKMIIERGVKGDIPETPKKENRRVKHIIIGDNFTALQGVYRRAKDMGIKVKIMTSTLRGDIKEVSKVIVSIVEEIIKTGNPFKAPVLLIFGGETTVKVVGNGRGGRNQELVLHLLKHTKNNLRIYVLAGGTDGIDGNTDLAGAVVGPEDWHRAMNKGLDIDEILRNNDSYTFHKLLGTGIKTGYTGTNVADILLVYIGKQP